MWSRRTFLLGSLTIPFAARANAQHRDLIDAAYTLAEDDQETLGATPLPRGHPMWDIAADYLDNAPTSGRPYDVARYLSQLPSELIAEWPQPYGNPLIMLQFVATDTSPTGDVTPWCAAFLSWCIERVGFSSMRSASSQAYLRWSVEVWRDGGDPARVQEGDVVVFTRQSDSRFGHVGFFRGWENPPSLRVLGGNQSNTIGEQLFRANRDLKLVSIRWA